jgi:hypothetical protein
MVMDMGVAVEDNVRHDQGDHDLDDRALDDHDLDDRDLDDRDLGDHRHNLDDPGLGYHSLGDLGLTPEFPALNTVRLLLILKVEQASLIMISFHPLVFGCTLAPGFIVVSLFNK